MTDEDQLELSLGNPTQEDITENAVKGTPVQTQDPTSPVIIGVFIAGSGSSTPELHVTYTPVGGGQTQIFISALSNPVTATQIAGIMSSLN